MQLETPPILAGTTDPREWNALTGWLSMLHTVLGSNFSHRVYVTTKSAAATLRREEQGIVFVQTATAPFTLTLPPGAQVGPGGWFWVFKTDGGANAVTLDGNGAEPINGAATYAAVNAQYEGALLLTTGVTADGWFVLATT